MRRFIALMSLAACVGTAVRAAPASPAAPFEDTMAQRTLACTACHGKEGRAAPDGYYPRIAGKPGGYLYNQLLNFRDGRRHYGLMTRLLDPLSDAYLMEIAQHFASLDVPYPAPQPAAVPAAVLERGRKLAQDGDAGSGVPGCVQCHGARLTGVMPGTPGLLGLPRDYLNSQLGAWRTGQRRAQAPDCMAQIAKKLTAEDLTAVAAWLSSQPLPADTKPAAAVAQPPSIACGP
ncbi:c-type cytochrome [Caenimonas koreensis DSM 17982]|uniref:C-type cytochrome n=1 Tax=Caenimonas koreensis DSM 17982 TaxID=1121255 RepID=A0A844B8J9_9BURK|nr:c-type cytochrome [Caenimonas koreensis]MRD47807.1 c-type cytochrome [Caenimonas koreensis DSM 17982]